jgi:hypothetical protein
MAFQMVFIGVFERAPYPGYAMAGLRAMTQTADGLVALGSFLGLLVALVIGIFARARTHMPESASGQS